MSSCSEDRIFKVQVDVGGVVENHDNPGRGVVCCLTPRLWTVLGQRERPGLSFALLPPFCSRGYRNTMRHPFQCLLARPLQHDRRQELLIAAAGPYLHIYDLHDGNLISSWPQALPSLAVLEEDGLPPQKRVKLSPLETESLHEPIISITEPSAKKNGRVKETSAAASFNRLAITKTGQHVVAITDEDKCVRVFLLDESGRLGLLNERSLTRRPQCLLSR